jgi:drug/metabolite transporter (DMT)-like permease
LSGLSSNVRGIILMVLAAGAFVINDSLFKLASTDLPTFQAMFMRGVAAAIWCLPLVFITRSVHRMGMIFNRWALLRNGFEIVTVFCFLTALTQMPLADITAIGQLSPMILLIGAALIFKEQLGRMQMVLIAMGFVGAMLIAQPTGEGVSPFAVLGFVAALGMAARDLAARMVPADMPGPVVAYGAVIMVMSASLIASLLFETWVMPPAHTLGFLAAAGFFLMFVQLFIFMTFRVAPVGVVAPFLYSATIWALVIGLLFFAELPNPVAFGGIALVTISGVLLVMRSRRAAMARVAIDTK